MYVLSSYKNVQQSFSFLSDINVLRNPKMTGEGRDPWTTNCPAKLKKIWHHCIKGVVCSFIWSFLCQIFSGDGIHKYKHNSCMRLHPLLGVYDMLYLCKTPVGLYLGFLETGQNSLKFEPLSVKHTL